MSSVHQDREQDSVDLAINRVLEAERGARDEVERCRRQAARILVDAEDQSRRIARRAEHRIRAAHRIADAGVEMVLRTLAEHTPVDAATGEGTDVLLDRVAATLADEIIGIET